MSAYVILDFGTGGGKCVVFDECGRLLGASSEGWTYQLDEVDAEIPFVKKLSFDAPRFWDILCRCTRNAMDKARLAPGDIDGIATTSQREGCVFLDAGDHEVYAGPNVDARGFREALEVLNVLGAERLYRITGHSAPFIFPLARYLWYRKQGGRDVAHLFMINDWMTWRLCGERCAEPSNAAESMLFDLEHRTWSQELLSAFAVPESILPSLRRCGERVGTLTAAAAQATGLLAGTPVFLGGADTQCSLLGSAVVQAGEMAATLGTTTPVQLVCDQATFDTSGNLWAGCHVVPERWVLESNAGDTGNAYLWLLELIGGGADREQLFALGETLARGSPATDSMLFIGPTVFNLNDMRLNRPGGWLFPFPSLHLRPERGTLVRAFLESVAYAVRANVEQLASVAGHTPNELTVSGGMSRSGLLKQAIADVTGLRVRASAEPESACLGCAVLIAAHQDGGDYHPAMDRMVRHYELTPNPEAHSIYDATYRKWRVLYDQLGEMEI